MSKLCISLPPFAPDYSGAASALFDMGGMIVVHDASGCTGNYTGYDEPRWYGSNSAVFCSGLRHMDAVLGNDDVLINKIVEAAKELNPKFIAILGSPVPMVIGTDFNGIANEIEYVTGIPSIGLPTRGLSYYGKGVSDALVQLMEKFVNNKEEMISGTINLLGITPLDFYINSNAEDFKKLFEENEIPVLASFSMGMQIENMQISTAAQLNVAVSQSGVQFAEYMKRKYNIPYIAVTPIGNGGVALQTVRDALAGNTKIYTPVTENAEILIVGEQIINNSIREYLQKEYSSKAITVANLFDVSKEYMAKNDVVVKNETQLRKMINAGNYKTIIGDPMVKQLICSENAENIHFHELPHVAISSKVHWEEYKVFLSEEMEKWLGGII